MDSSEILYVQLGSEKCGIVFIRSVHVNSSKELVMTGDLTIPIVCPFSITLAYPY